MMQRIEHILCLFFLLFIFFLGSRPSPYERAGKCTANTIHIQSYKETVLSDVLPFVAQTLTFLVLFLSSKNNYMDSAHLFSKHVWTRVLKGLTKLFLKKTPDSSKVKGWRNGKWCLDVKKENKIMIKRQISIWRHKKEMLRRKSGKQVSDEGNRILWGKKNIHGIS